MKAQTAIHALPLILLTGCVTAPSEKFVWRVSDALLAHVSEQMVPESQASDDLRFRGQRSSLKVVRELAAGEREATALFESRRAAIERLLEVQVDPYYGARSRIPECEPLPVSRSWIHKENNEWSARFNLAATKDLQLGCQTDQAPAWKAQVTLLYCPGAKAFYQATYFYPLAGRTWNEPAITCAR